MRDDPRACMIFAAGFGTRMAPLTDTRPKPLIEVAGKTLLQHALNPARAAGLAPIVVNAHYRAADVTAALAQSDVAVSFEAEKILDTGGGLKKALPLLGAGPVFTMNSDAVWAGPNPFDVLGSGWRAGFDALLLCAPMVRAAGRSDAGDFSIASDGTFTRGPGFVYTGAQILRTERVAAYPDDVFSLNRIWDDMMETGTIRAAIYPGQWCDVGRPSSIPLAESLVHVSDV